MNCSDPLSLAKDAKCYRCIPKGMLQAVKAWLLCQWLKKKEEPVARFSYEPDFAVISWTDSGGAHSGDLATFYAITAVTGVGTVTDMNAGAAAITAFHNLSSLTALMDLNCDHNPALAALDLTGCDALVSLSCSDCGFVALDVSPCTSLTTLNCSANGALAALTLSPSLTGLDCGMCASLTGLALAGLTHLSVLNCNSCNITGTLVIPTAMVTLNCSLNSNLTALTLTGCTALTTLDCSSCINLASLDVSPCVNISSLSAGGNVTLTGATITGCTLLVAIDFSFCSFAQAAVDAVLCTTDTNGALNGTLDITFNTAPSAAGLVCSANLDPGKGWTVSHD